MKKVVDTKKLLFENMEKLNPDFKLNEEDDKWIQGAVNPEHKGYCTPMTKDTCTPKRKALAQRFKKGDLSEIATPQQQQQMVGDVKAYLDNSLNNGDYNAINRIYLLMQQIQKGTQ
jgi:hypothetical protein